MAEPTNPQAQTTPTLYELMGKSCHSSEQVYVFCYAFLDTAFRLWLSGAVDPAELKKQRFQLDAARLAVLADLRRVENTLSHRAMSSVMGRTSRSS